MAKVDDHDIAIQTRQRAVQATETINHLKTVRASEAWYDLHVGPIRHAHGLGGKLAWIGGPIAEAIGQAAVVEVEEQQVRNGSSLHVAIDEDYPPGSSERPRQRRRQKCRRLSGASRAHSYAPHGVAEAPGDAAAQDAPHRTRIASSALKGDGAICTPGTV